MTTKQILYSLGGLIVLALIFAGLSSLRAPASAPTAGDKSAILGGTLGSDGVYHYSEDKDYYKVTADYPASTGLSSAADLKARTTIEQSLAQQITTFKQDGGLDTLTAEDAQMQGLSAEHYYSLGLEYKAASSSSTVSYAYQVYADTLGAHPNLYYKTFVFDQDGNELALADLFVASSTSYLKQISDSATSQIKDQLTQKLGEAPGESFFAEGTAANADNFQSFVIDGNELVFLIPPYQVAAYAAGAFEVHITLSQLSTILKSELL